VCQGSPEFPRSAHANSPPLGGVRGAEGGSALSLLLVSRGASGAKAPARLFPVAAGPDGGVGRRPAALRAVAAGGTVGRWGGLEAGSLGCWTSPDIVTSAMTHVFATVLDEMPLKVSERGH
jgi:hypothetical protein